MRSRHTTPHRPSARRLRRVPAGRRSRAGLSIVEMVIAAGLVAVLVLATAAALGENVESTGTARRMTTGAVFLESVQEDLAALGASDLLAMNGQRVYSEDDWQNAPYACDVTVFSSSPTLLQVEVRLVDQQKSTTLATLHTFRAIV